MYSIKLYYTKCALNYLEFLNLNHIIMFNIFNVLKIETYYKT